MRAEGGSVLEVGCGAARNLIEAARLYPNAQLSGLDISQEMLSTAHGKIMRAGCSIESASPREMLRHLPPVSCPAAHISTGCSSLTRCR
jgi:ubiquinone/menaquinone biosynthesis C-methylase UbiE